MFSPVKTLFGSRNERIVRRMRRTVEQINALEPQMEALADLDLREQTARFRLRAAAGETLDALLPEVFAAVREAARRTLDMRHFDVQLIGGMILHQGNIAEMRTGEGKTLVATLAASLHALSGAAVHVVTVNDYLARRDAEWMGAIYRALGLSVGVIVAGIGPAERQAAYRADIVYGTNNEFGFDYLRDNMAFAADERAQRGLGFAIVDEVDSILIDEARTPLIISGAADDASTLYEKIDRIVRQLTPAVRREKGGEADGEKVGDEGGEETGAERGDDAANAQRPPTPRPMERARAQLTGAEIEAEESGDYTVDEKQRQALLTEQGHERVEALLTKAGLLQEGSLYDAGNITLMHHVSAALRARALYQRDVHYIVQGGQVVIVDEFTGRTMPGRRWGEGLHQAMEAKEGVAIQSENQTLASITFQNYFRLYDTLSGMTGTADTEAYEFQQIYGLEVVVVPTHRPMVRADQADLVYLTAAEKYRAILADIRDCHARGQPALVGVASIETSELLSAMLQRERPPIPHQVLNAKQHEREAQVVAQAGRPGAITIATNMAGRGTDIVLGGNPEAAAENQTDAEAQRAAWRARHEEVIAAGGLHIIGTERNESRRIDNQFRGRSGRQGDPGSSRFYLSLEDPLMRIFASERVAGMMHKLGMQKGEAIEHPWVTKAIENAQRKVEGHNFDIRKNLLEFDDVANDQRTVIYGQRNELMDVDDISATVRAIRSDVVRDLMADYIPPESLEEQWDLPGLEATLEREFGLNLKPAQWLRDDPELHEETLYERIIAEMEERYAQKEQQTGVAVIRQFEKAVMLQVLDLQWKEHLQAMDHLRQGIHLRGYAQKNPKQEYKREAFDLFTAMLNAITREALALMTRLQVRAPEDVEAVEARRRAAVGGRMRFQHAAAAQPLDDAPSAAESPRAARDGTPTTPKRRPMVRQGLKVGRNAPCPCGSGKKYKQCHGKAQARVGG